ncbi:MAG: EFR1 family ferrodoxin [Spirochaetia bacterium]
MAIPSWFPSPLRAVRYTFAIATCGGTAANTLPRMGKALRRNGGHLDAAFIVRSAGYMESTEKESLMIARVRRLSGRLFPTEKERLPEIIEMVRDEKHGSIERNALPGALLGGFFHGKAVPAFTKMDALYRVSDACAGCGTCTRICPRGNVKLENGKPQWHHDCDNCGTCATWCPHNAIGRGGAAPSPRRHNAAVVAADLRWA